MSAMHRSTLMRLAVTAAAGAVLLGCTETVYKDFPGFAPPPTGAGEYVGYSTTSSKLTTCGNCHASHQALWITAKHSTAWADLQASGHASSTCNMCHTVNTSGNDTNTTATGGYLGSTNERYQDVQCEACHGPGQEHVNNPETKATQPVPSIHVWVGVKTSCSGCHTGGFDPFVDEWSHSSHGLMPNIAHTLGNATCQPCHSGQGAIRVTMGVTTTDYKEMNNPLTTYDTLANGTRLGTATLGIVCAVCHDPHGSPNLAQTRFPPDTQDVTQNLCARCHNYNASPTSATTYRGPMAYEGPLVIGTNLVGWRPPNMTVDNIHGSHGDTTVNKTLCATCHLAKTSITDSSGNTFNSTGHLFLAIPCTDAFGKPVPGDCAETSRTFAACTASGCHGAGVAKTLMDTEVIVINSDLTQLYTKLQAVANSVKPGYGCAVFTSTTGSPWTTARGARFNYLLAAAAGTAPAGQPCGNNLALPPAVSKLGSAVHNVPLMEQLLVNSLAQLNTDYPSP